MDELRFAWLEITGKCQLACTHCYADSGPDGTHGRMDEQAWGLVIHQLATLGAGAVQFIGGEPMLHPSLPALLEHALAQRPKVEMFSNLAYIPAAVWPLLEHPAVSLATLLQRRPRSARRRHQASQPQEHPGEHRGGSAARHSSAGRCR